MKRIRAIFKFLAIIIMLTLVTSFTPNLSNIAIVQAATTLKINKTQITLEVGKSTTLNIPGTSKKVTWSTSDKSIATVNSKGKVTAKKKGKVTITATVDKKKYTCKVTVKKPISKYIAKAPFVAKELMIDQFKTVIPKDWECNEFDAMFSTIAMINSKDVDYTASNYSHLIIYISENQVRIPPDNNIQEKLEETYSESNILDNYGADNLLKDGIRVTVSNIETIVFKGTLGNVYKTSYTVAYFGGEKDYSIDKIIYDFYMDTHYIQIIAKDFGENPNMKPSLSEVSEYMFKSLQVRR